MPSEPAEVVARGTSFSAVSIGTATGAVVGLGYARSGWAAWLTGALAFTVLYVLMVGLELGLAGRAHPEGAKEG
ncbi:MAG TPA: hypothetical protein VFI54_07115 [Solirubrobacteraceae bacterium]|nr:hypothetical protein [Solirubrobacteraceae bacterium]